MNATLPEWLGQLATLQRAGTPLPPALESMEAYQPRPLRDASRRVCTELREGKSLPQAFREAGVPLAEEDLAALEFGHEAARLDEVLNEISLWMQKNRDWNRRARRALIYPLLVIHLAGILPTLPLGLNYGPAVALLYLMVALGPLYALLAAALAVHQVMQGPSRRGALLARWKLRIPLIGPAWHYEAASRFCSFFRSGLLSGARMNELLPLAGRASRNRWIAEQFRAVAPTMEDGASLTDIFLSARALPPTTLSLLTTGDQSGALDTLALNAQQHAESSADVFWNRAQVALTAIAYIWAVGLVLVAIAATLGPYYLMLYQLLDN